MKGILNRLKKIINPKTMVSKPGLWLWLAFSFEVVAMGQIPAEVPGKALLKQSMEKMSNLKYMGTRMGVFSKFRFVLQYYPKPGGFKAQKEMEVETFKSRNFTMYRSEDVEMFQDLKHVVTVSKKAKLVNINVVDQAKPFETGILESLSDKQQEFLDMSQVVAYQDTTWDGKAMKLVRLVPSPQTSYYRKFSRVDYVIDPTAKKLVAQKHYCQPGGNMRYYWIYYLKQERKKTGKGETALSQIYLSNQQLKAAYQGYRIEDITKL